MAEDKSSDGDQHEPGTEIEFEDEVDSTDDPKVTKVNDGSEFGDVEVEDSSESSEREETPDQDSVETPEDEAPKLNEEIPVEPAAHEDEETHHEHAKIVAGFSPLKSKLAKVKQWFGVKKNRYIAGGATAALLVLVIAVQPIRFGILNTIGVRAVARVTVTDQSSDLPLKNVTVTIGDKEATTDRNGLALIDDLKMGSYQIAIEKLAYAALRQTVTINTGTNDLGIEALEPVGTQFTFNIVDWLSGSPVAGAEVSSGENSVLSSADGTALLTVPPTTDSELTVRINAANYRSEEIKISTAEEGAIDVEVVVNRPHLYVSKRSGKYDLRKVDLDGSEDELILAGTGNESRDIHLVNDPLSNTSYFVSSREGNRNDEGSILYGLFRINTQDGSYDKLDESESIRVYGISSSRLIYVKIASGASGTNPQRQRLMSYDPISGGKLEIYATNYFNTVTLTDEAVFYATSDYYKEERAPYLYRADPNDGSKTVVHAGEVWSIYRTAVDSITFDARQDWYSVSLDSGAKPVSLEGRPADISSRLYVLSPDGSQALWVDGRDGKDYLILIDTDTAEETNLHIGNGLKYPVYWLDDTHVVFRVVTDSESGDYVIDTTGGSAVKLVDVSDVGSYDRWYYYY